MRNGQLKPGYNVQIGVESEYIIGVGLFPNPTDTTTLIPFLERVQNGCGRKYRNIIADAGCSHREECFKGQYENRKISLSQTMARQKREATERITTDKGITLRMNRSIQVEGAFGVLKEDYAFRRFLTRGKRKTETQFFLLCFAFHIRKLCNRSNSERFHKPLFEKIIA